MAHRFSNDHQYIIKYVRKIEEKENQGVDQNSFDSFYDNFDTGP